MSRPRVQVSVFPVADAPGVVVQGDLACNADPCAHHGVCHCRCVCGLEADDDCADCAEEDA